MEEVIQTQETIADIELVVPAEPETIADVELVVPAEPETIADVELVVPQKHGIFFSKTLEGFIYSRFQNVPTDSVEITADEHIELLLGQARGLRIVSDEEGRPALISQPEPTTEQLKEQFIATIQAHMDAEAKKAGYDDVKSAVTYADEPSVPKFQLEGMAFREWRSLVWAFAYSLFDAVMAGTRQMPTIEGIISELPVLHLPS